MDGDAGGQSRATTNDFDAGMRVRKDVLGAAHVDRSMAAASEFALPLQELVTEYCWGRIWTRPGLDRKTRSLLNLGVLTALNPTNGSRLAAADAGTRRRSSRSCRTRDTRR